MPNKKNHRRFGSVRKLPSGRYQASYLGPEGQRRNAPETFQRKGDSERWLTVLEGEVLRGEWIDPLAGRVTLGEYGTRWVVEHRITQRTREEYESLWRMHVEPFLGDVELANLTTDRVRSWRAELLASGRSEDRTAKAYTLLRAVLNTAADDGRIRRNPCRIKGAGHHRTPERPIATVPQVFALALAVPLHLRALILAAAFTGLRWGELIALRRCDIDLAAGVLRVHRSLSEMRGGVMREKPPKSEAGVRTVALPTVLVEDFRTHLAEHGEPDSTGLIFVGDRGGPLRRGNFHRATKWTATVVRLGLPLGFHFHDLRHTGNQLVAESGASTKELMHRMGHGSMRAAIIYQHATAERDRILADRLSTYVEGKRDGAAADTRADG